MLMTSESSTARARVILRLAIVVSCDEKSRSCVYFLLLNIIKIIIFKRLSQGRRYSNIGTAAAVA